MGITSVPLKPEIENSLKDLSKELDRSKSYLINMAIKEFLDRKASEDNRWKETINAINSVTAGNVVAEEEVNTWLNSWGKDDELTPPIS